MIENIGDVSLKDNALGYVDAIRKSIIGFSFENFWVWYFNFDVVERFSFR